MTEYKGLGESTLRSILDDCSSFEERRKIRAAIRQLKDGLVRAHSFHLGSSNTSGPRHIGQGSSLIGQGSSHIGQGSSHISQGIRHIPRPSFGVQGNSQTTISVHSHQPVIRTSTSTVTSTSTSTSETKPAENLANIKRSLNLALAKTVKTQQSCSVEFQNGVASSNGSDRTNSLGSGLQTARQLTNGSSLFEPTSAHSGSSIHSISDFKLSERTYNKRLSEMSAQSSPGTHHTKLDDSEINYCSEERLQELLNKSTDFAERRKLRNRLKQLREKKDEGGNQEKGGALPPRSMTATPHRPPANQAYNPLNIDYDKIETMEEFKTLLSVTDDYEEKRKIRNAMRQLRKRLELEKVKLSAGNRNKANPRRQSEDPGVRRASVADARRRLSEDVNRSALSPLLTKHDIHSGSRDLGPKSKTGSRDLGPKSHTGNKDLGPKSHTGNKDLGPKLHTGSKDLGVKARDKVGKQNVSIENADKTEGKVLDSTHLPIQQGHLQSAKDEDFLVQIKARLSTHEKFVSGNEEQRKAILTNTSKSNLSKSPKYTHSSADNSQQLTTNSAKKSKEDKSAPGSTSSVKVTETRSVPNKRSQTSSDKNQATFKSSLLVKLNSNKNDSDSVSKLIVNKVKNKASNKRVLPDLDKLKKDSLEYSIGQSFLQQERLSVSDKHESSKANLSNTDGIELYLTTATESEPLSSHVSHKSTGSVTRTLLADCTPSESDLSPSADSHSSGQKLSGPVSAHAGRASFKPLIFKLDPRPKGRGLSRSQSDVLPQTGAGYRRAYQSQCQPAIHLESKSDMEKAFVDMLQDMDAELTVGMSEVRDARAGDQEQTHSPDSHQGTSSSVDLSAIPFVDEEESSVDQHRRQGREMDTDNNTLVECDETKSAEPMLFTDEENNNVLGKGMDSESLPPSSDTTLVLSGEVVAPEVGESAITYREEEDGTTTVQQVSRTDTQDQTVTVKSKMYRTLSNAQAEERDTIVETTSSTPGGSTLKERDVVRTRKKITSRGSNYYQRSVQVTRRVKDKSGNELVHQDLSLESDNKSVSQGHAWGDRVVTQVTLHQPAHLQHMVGEGTSTPKKSHATLVLNKLNLSKASSGYGSVSGSEEEDREEIVDVNNSRPKGCPEIRRSLEDTEVDAGKEMKLECAGVADPPPSVTWHCGEEEVQESDPGYSLHWDLETASLTVHSPQVSTRFSCVFSNQHGQAETTCSLTVRKHAQDPVHSEQSLEQVPTELGLEQVPTELGLEQVPTELGLEQVPTELGLEQVPTELGLEQMPPGVEEGLKDQDVTEGHSLTLSCCLSHADSVLWYHDNTLLTQSQDFKQSYDGSLARLEISEMFLDDAGEYACVARNSFGEARSACQMSVTACDGELAVVPMFLTALESHSLSVGDKLVLECDVIGSPEPELSWTKDGCPLRDDCAYNQMFDGRTARLEIEDIQIVDSGRYECVAVNEAGRVSNDARITVKVKNKGPSVAEALSNVSIKSGETATLVCQMSGFPQPCIIWRKNGMMIGQTKDFKQSYADGKATLEICGACVQDTGQYECVARNSLGETSTSSSLTVTDVSPASSVPTPSTVGMTSASVSWTPTRPSHIPLTSSSTQPAPTASGSSPSSPLHSHIIARALTRSASHHITSSRSSSPPSNIIQRALDKGNSSSPTPETSNVPGIVKVVPMEPGSGPVPTMTSPLSGRAAPQNTIGKFLALAAARELEQPKSLPLKTTLDTEPADSIVASTDVNHTTKSNEPTHKHPAPVNSGAISAESTQHLSKVQQLRLQFLKGSDQSQSSNSNSAPIRRWHSLPPQDLRPTVIKREHQELGGGKQRPVNMPFYDDVNDEEELMKIMSKTDDFDERKKLRARLKEVREKDKLDREARRQQREKEAGDVVKQKFEKAEEDKKRRMQQFSDMAAKPGTQTTTETKTGADGSSTTTTTSTSTSKTADGGTRTQTVKKTETTIKKTSGIGGVQYAKPGAEETARKLSDHLKTVTSPGTSGRIAVTTESWSSRDGLHHKSEKTETWGAKPGGARGAMAAFKQMDSTNSPAQPNAGRGRGMARSPSTIKQMLLDWCKSKTKEYENIEITNFSSCWNNGIAFCALIHHFFPDAFDYYALNPKNRRYNFDLAFDTAEKMADIAPLLDTDDMVKMKNPDWKCVFTYVQSIYRHLREHDANQAKEQ